MTATLAPELEHIYTPRGAAQALFAARDAEVLLAGPAGTGKSRACLEKVQMMCLTNPGLRALVVRKTLASLSGTGIVTYREHVAAEALALGVVKFFGGSAQRPAQFAYSNGSVLVVGGLDKAQVTKIMSSEFDVIFVQEATELGVTEWEALTTRLRNGRCSFQQIIGDCNPSAPSHWLNQRCEAGLTRMIPCSHRDNPVLYDDSGALTDAGSVYLGRLDRLTGVRRLRLAEGLWAAAEGLVYEEYDPAVHLVDSLPKGADDWTRYWTVDFGYRNPLVCQFWAESPDGDLYLYREIYRTGRLVEDHAKQILALVAPGGTWKEPQPRAVICDHDAEDRATLERHLGLSTVAAVKTVRPGIEAVQARLRPDDRGKPRLYFLRDALVEKDAELAETGAPWSTVQEITGYSWPDDVKPEQREAPIKRDDHGMDSLRYLVAHVDLAPTPRIRVMRW